MRKLLATALLVGAAARATAADYVTIRHEVVVDRPAGAVWARVGGYCMIAEWLKVTCELVSGTGDVGTVRRLNGTTLEPMVAKTAHSYTYAQTAGLVAGREFHGTLAVEPDGPTRSHLSYTLVYDAALMPSEAVRASERARLEQRFVGPLGVMKSLAEAR